MEFYLCLKTYKQGKVYAAWCICLGEAQARWREVWYHGGFYFSSKIKSSINYDVSVFSVTPEKKSIAFSTVALIALLSMPSKLTRHRSPVVLVADLQILIVSVPVMFSSLCLQTLDWTDFKYTTHLMSAFHVLWSVAYLLPTSFCFTWENRCGTARDTHKESSIDLWWTRNKTREVQCLF